MMNDKLPRNGRFDLHLHSTVSDGKFAPEEVIRRALDGGLNVIALTDHDLPPTVPYGRHEVGGQAIRVIAGCEVTGSHDGREFHLLVYFPGEIPGAFHKFCAAQARERLRRYQAAVKSIGLGNLGDTAQEALEGERSLTRLHLAHALVDAGHARNVRDAFARYLSASRAKVPLFGLAFTDAIRIARSLGGVTSWAHPPVPMVKKYLDTFARSGLQGLEALRPFMTHRHRATLRKNAKTHGLFLTGGSDWHGWKDPNDLGLYAVNGHEVEDFVTVLNAA
jgi:3',5'-nucleoside bisphosphate phosphatase